ncbi:glycosyltransferase [Devosia sp. BK]|uniref:glycosyltransferase n=1 Tax=Devosia sp. BK TaxID=2871706 RepID=UPI00293AB626|nr:glycosyltransferase [Devosia sp. BK]MDV3253678.1 glycosyltransferase [Devosia sp. BK]
MTRILFFHPDGHPTFRPDVAILFGKYMTDNGVFCDVVSHATGQSAVPTEWQNSALYLARGGKLSRLLFTIQKLVSLRFRDYDAVLVRDMPIIAWLIFIKALFARTPFLYWRSFPIALMDLTILKKSWGDISWLRRAWLALKGGGGALLERMLIANSFPAHTFVQSKAMALEVQGWGANPRNVTAVPMCIDPERFPSSIRNIESTIPRVIYVGACDRPRGVDVMISMLEELARRNIHIELAIVGDAQEPADREWLRETIKRSPASEKIIFTGWVSTSEVSRHLDMASIAICLTPVDSIFSVGSPTKLVEYMASGLPVIVNEHPDQTDLISSSGGGIISNLSPIDLANSVESIISDNIARSAMGGAGRSYVLQNRNYVMMSKSVAEVIRHAIV